MLLMHLLTETHLEKGLRAKMYLEILGNTLVTEDTAAWIRKTAGKLDGILSSDSSDILDSWDLSLLKEKEKEQMGEVFKVWKLGHGGRRITEHWRARQQKLLGIILEEIYRNRQHFVCSAKTDTAV